MTAMPLRTDTAIHAPLPARIVRRQGARGACVTTGRLFLRGLPSRASILASDAGEEKRDGHDMAWFTGLWREAAERCSLRTGIGAKGDGRRRGLIDRLLPRTYHGRSRGRGAAVGGNGAPGTDNGARRGRESARIVRRVGPSLVAVLLLSGCLAPPPGAEASRGAVCEPRLDWPDTARIGSCVGGQRVTLAVAGDVLLHSPLQRRGYAEGFDAIWGAAVPYLAAADIAVVNLEGPVAAGIDLSLRPRPDPGPVFDGQVYTEYPRFNYHPQLVAELRAAGVDLVTTANNHALDRGWRGAEATLAALSSAGMAQTGLIGVGAPRDFATHLATPLGTLSFVGCSFSTNGIPDPHRQVLMCYQDRAELLEIVRAEVARDDVAGVVVLPHWGQEYVAAPDADQQSLARDLAGAGAIAVIGTHPHVIQPWEVLTPAESPSGGAPVPVVYSTGNFVSGQGGLGVQTGVIALLELCRPGAVTGGSGLSGDRLSVARAGWIPLFMTRTQDGPLLLVPSPDMEGMPGASRGLVAGRVPGRDLSARLACRVPASHAAILARPG